MKKNSQLIILFCIISILLASYGSVGIYIDNDKTLEFKYSFEQPTITTTNENGSISHAISIQDLPQVHDAGKPILPVKPVKILLPYKTTIQDISVFSPFNPIVYDQIKPKYGASLLTIDANSQETTEQNTQTDSEKQESLIDTMSLQRYRGFSILFITLKPIIYDDATHQLVFYPQIQVKIKTKEIDDSSSNFKFTSLDIDHLQSFVENPSCIHTYPIEQIQTSDVSYVIITNEKLAQSNLEYNFNTLLNAKKEKGMNAELFTVEDIISDSAYTVNGTWGDNNPSNPFFQQPITKNYHFFDDTAARIRNFIRYAYMELGTTYVLLGGDGDFGNDEQNIIPARGLFANESGLPLIDTMQTLDEEQDDLPSDLYYACLDGTFNADMDMHFGESPDRNDITEEDEADLMAEVFVGRACVDSANEINHFVSKTLTYEQTHHPYLSKILFVGEYLGFPGISAYGGNYKDLIVPLIPDFYNLETLYDRDMPYEWNKYDMIELINNATPHIINHDGHSYYGYNLKMHNSDIDQLTNTNTFFLYSHGCMAGGFDNPQGYDCIAERLTVETPYGAFAAIMNSRYGLGSENSLDSPSLFLDTSFFQALFEENIREIGRANHYSKEDNIWRINENGVRWVVYETNLFGDPELSIKTPTQEPAELDIKLLKPEENGMLYIRNSPLFLLPLINNPVILGPITMEVLAESDPKDHVYSVEFLLNNQSFHEDTNKPYTWMLDEQLKGYYQISVIAKGYYGESLRKDVDAFIWMKG